MAPFELMNFLKLVSFRDFSYQLMSPALIISFLNKRFDLADPSEKHPPLNMDQIAVREKLEKNVAKFEQKISL